MLEFNPVYSKKSHVWKYHLIFFFHNFTKDFISFRRYYTKEAALRKEPHKPFKPSGKPIELRVETSR